MDIKYLTVDKVPEEAYRLLKEQEEGMIVNFGDHPFCVSGRKALINEEVCKEHDIPTMQTHYIGGSIVGFPGDLSIMEVKQGRSYFGLKCLQTVAHYLTEKGMDVAIMGNDLMIFNKDKKELLKVGSYGSSLVKDMTQSVVHFSIGMNIDLVKEICIKPMNKIPGALGDYGVTAEELWDVIQNIVS